MKRNGEGVIEAISKGIEGDALRQGGLTLKVPFGCVGAERI
jgi:hypothetical protein